MSPDQVAAHPAAPESIAEWEELLLRMELLPRALRVTMEEVPAGEEHTARALERALEREVELARWLGAASGEPAPPPADADPSDVRSVPDRLASLRARSFAMLQRRGLEVWSWTAPLGDARPTAYQMIAALVGADAETLATLREGRRLGSSAC